MKLNKLTIMLGAAVMANAAFANQTCEAPYRSALPAYTYKLDKVLEVNGRQGITTDGKYLYVSGSKTLAKYDMDGKLIKENKDPFVDKAVAVLEKLYKEVEAGVYKTNKDILQKCDEAKEFLDLIRLFF